MVDGGTAYRRPSCGVVPRRVLLGTPFFRVGNRKQKPLGGPGTGSTPFLEPIVPRSKRALGPAHSRGAGTRRNAASPGKAGGAFAAGTGSCSGGGAPPHSPARPFFPYWVVLRLGRGADLGVSLGRRIRAGSEREPDSRKSSVIQIAEFVLVFFKNCANRH